MALRPLLPDNSRELRDGELVVDCAIAREALARSTHKGAEEALATAIGISRGVLRRLLGKDGDGRWSVVTIQNAQAFATACGIVPETLTWASEADGIIPSQVADYLRRWKQIQGLGAGPYVALPLQCGQHSVTLADLVEKARAAPAIQIVGASGAGKSHLLLHLGLHMASAGFCPIGIRAANYIGHLEEQIAKAMASSTTLTPNSLMKASRAAGFIPILLVDALNECPPSHRTALIGELQSQRLHHNMHVVMTGQAETKFPDDLAPVTISAAPLNRDFKRAVIEAHLGHALPEIDPTLDMVTSAHDAMVLATVFADGFREGSRYALYSEFVRRRLGEDDVGIRSRHTLAEIATQMRNSFVYALPRTSVARAARQACSGLAAEAAIIRRIEESGLFPGADGQVSFRHELFQAFFAAEALLHSCATAEDLAQALRVPLHAELAELALGSLSQSIDIISVLNTTQNMALFTATLNGRCGPKAARIVKDMAAAAIGRLTDMMCAVSFEYADVDRDADRYVSVEPEISACQPLQPLDDLYLATAAAHYDGELLDQLLSMFARIDQHIEAERQRLRAKYPERKLAWRAAMFTTLYCFPGPKEIWALQRLLQARKISSFWEDTKKRFQLISTHLQQPQTLTPGQLYFLIEDIRTPSDDHSVPAYLYDLADHAWRFGIYHLRIITAHMMMQFMHDLPDDATRARFRGLVESWLSNEPMLNSSVIDVLKSLDALGEQFTEDDALVQYENILAMPDSEEASEAAFTIYSHMFDHPYDDAYCRAYHHLSEEKRAALLARAVHTQSTDSMFFSFLLSEIGKRATPDMAPALHRASIVPNSQTFSSQEAVSVFVGAVAGLAALGIPLAVQVRENELDQAWGHGAQILYYFYCLKDAPARQAATVGNWEALRALKALDVPLRLLRDRYMRDDDFITEFGSTFRQPLLAMSRDRLLGAHPAISIFGRGPEDLPSEHSLFALNIIELHGDRSDLILLSSLSTDLKLGARAIAAARAIERR